MQRIPSGRVVFNVSGKLYETTRATLEKFPDSMLMALLRNVDTTSSDPIFIDRDAKLFRWILECHRRVIVTCKDVGVSSRLWDEELDYFGIAFPIEEEQEPVGSDEVKKLHENVKRLRGEISEKETRVQTLSDQLLGEQRKRSRLTKECNIAQLELDFANFVEYLLDCFHDFQQVEFDFISLSVEHLTPDKRVRIANFFRLLGLIYCAGGSHYSRFLVAKFC